MATPMERPQLHVEGKDDQHSVLHILGQHGLSYQQKPVPQKYPEIKPMDGIEKLLESMAIAIKSGNDKPVGFILDADLSLSSRWQAVCQRLREADVDPPGQPPSIGFIGQSHKFQTRVGVWLMPDNQREGALEEFLKSLIHEPDRLIRAAEEATDNAQRLDARFPPERRSKAVIHTWLAWQEEPGKPYGTAITARYFLHDAPLAKIFVAWVRTLYQLD